MMNQQSYSRIRETRYRAKINKIKVDELIVKHQQGIIFDPLDQYRLSKAQQMDNIVSACYDIMKSKDSTPAQRIEATRRLNSIQSYYSSICV